MAAAAPQDISALPIRGAQAPMGEYTTPSIGKLTLALSLGSPMVVLSASPPLSLLKIRNQVRCCGDACRTLPRPLVGLPPQTTRC
jgi:hypothetical protein